jgi:hypothetical protein
LEKKLFRELNDRVCNRNAHDALAYDQRGFRFQPYADHKGSRVRNPCHA